ncbi:uncharacterized protein LOC110706126 [Chenopodium quinoa]|uniref:uncharacterized protein LOC110706126 n=1 Tax=Chenopodium quinoa TaxID=63459 RepID=UPI000B76F14E|nr:uncharacterized protein LOC110706126 [Chenopodium quinoa]
MAGQGNDDVRRNAIVLPPNQDPASICYIHPSDANVQLVSYKFSGEGFTSWKRSMLLTLLAKNKLGFFNGTISKPVAGTAECKAWERCNDLVCSLILFNLDDTIAKSVMFLKSAQEIWTDLEERFGYASMAQVYSLEQKLVDIKQGDNSISEFFTEIKSVWDAIEEAHPLPYGTCNNCTCNLTKKDFQRQKEKMVLQFMMKLTDQYATIRGNILMMQSLPKVTKAYRLFAQAERHKEISQTAVHKTESLACSNDSGMQYRRQSSKPGENYYCTHCQIPGHSIDRFFKLKGFPPGLKALKTTELQHSHPQKIQQQI